MNILLQIRKACQELSNGRTSDASGLILRTQAELVQHYKHNLNSLWEQHSVLASGDEVLISVRIYCRENEQLCIKT